MESSGLASTSHVSALHLQIQRLVRRRLGRFPQQEWEDVVQSVWVDVLEEVGRCAPVTTQLLFTLVDRHTKRCKRSVVGRRVRLLAPECSDLTALPDYEPAGAMAGGPAANADEVFAANQAADVAGDFWRTRLTPRQRLVLERRILYGEGVAEVGQTLGMSVDVVKNESSRAIARLRECCRSQSSDNSATFITLAAEAFVGWLASARLPVAANTMPLHEAVKDRSEDTSQLGGPGAVSIGQLQVVANELPFVGVDHTAFAHLEAINAASGEAGQCLIKQHVGVGSRSRDGLREAGRRFDIRGGQGPMTVIADQTAGEPPQLAHVSRPGVRPKGTQSGFGDRGKTVSLRGTRARKCFGQEAVEKEGDVFRTLAQRRDGDGNVPQAIIQIFSEPALIYERREVPVGSRYQAKVTSADPWRAQGAKLPLLNHPQQASLQLIRKLPQLVQKEHTTIGAGERPLTITPGFGKGAPDITKEFRLDQLSREVGAVYDLIGAARTRTQPMEGPGDGLLSSPCLAQDQHIIIAGRLHPHPGEQLPHGQAGTHQPFKCALVNGHLPGGVVNLQAQATVAEAGHLPWLEDSLHDADTLNDDAVGAASVSNPESQRGCIDQRVVPRSGGIRQDHVVSLSRTQPQDTSRHGITFPAMLPGQKYDPRILNQQLTRLSAHTPNYPGRVHCLVPPFGRSPQPGNQHCDTILRVSSHQQPIDLMFLQCRWALGIC